jgi:hypothetical protein
MPVLTVSPFSYIFDTTVYFKVEAINSLGAGLNSTLNLVGANIRSIPSAMAVPFNGVWGTSETQIMVNWTSLTGANTGNSAILGYELYWDA